MPAGSEMDPLLAKAEPISDGGASEITYLRRGKKNQLCNSNCSQRRVRIRENKNSADAKVSEEGAVGSAPVTRAEIPLQPLVKTMVRQSVPL
ncbi:protein pxr1-like [Limosa lapponica baueri]|uniref:Protein pxr1-like n=1 Tax=Limosa lapponica baueri TaxID=1758121 RepID=A0A2I0UDD7_LIMLA|nr:protein pxr1-like [Limosa lapponica baueri]